MKRLDVIRELAAVRNDAPVIVGPGASSGALYHTDHRDATIYNMEMGYAAAMCLGLALAAPDQRVVALEGDGSMVMGIGVLTTIGRYAPPNLVVVIVDNGLYWTTGYGDVETATGSGLDLAEFARAAGIPREQVSDVDQVDALREALGMAMSRPGPWIVRARVEPDVRGSGPKRIPEHDLVETAISLRRAMIARGYTAPSPL